MQPAENWGNQWVHCLDQKAFTNLHHAFVILVKGGPPLRQHLRMRLPNQQWHPAILEATIPEGLPRHQRVVEATLSLLRSITLPDSLLGSRPRVELPHRNR